MTEKLVKGEEFRKGVQKGIDELADAVKDTLGPMGNTVIIKTTFGEIIITKDGVTVAENIEFNPMSVESLGAELVKNVALKANNLAGDGTTTATVLAQAIYAEGVKHLGLGARPGDFVKGLRIALVDLLNGIESKEVTATSPEIKSVALVSSNGDEEIAQTITNIYKELGVHAVISPVQGNGMETTVNMVEGMQFDRGYLSSYSITDKIKMKIDFENPFIFIYDGKINLFSQVHPAVEFAAQKARPIIIVAEDVKESALVGLVQNHMRGVCASAVVMSPGYGGKRLQRLEDMAILFGGKVFNADSDMSQFKGSHLGEMEKAEITNKDTSFINGKGDQELIQERVKFIESQLVHHKGHKYEVDLLEDRLGKLTSGVAMIKVGALSREEGKELLDRVEDCKHAVRAALSEGVIEGGGLALLRQSNNLLAKNFKSDVPRDVVAGYNALLQAVKAPFYQILKNADVNPEVIEAGLVTQAEGTGYNVRKGEYVSSMIEEGIIDPYKVMRIALESSVSIVGTLLTSNYAVINEDDTATTTFS